MTPLLLRATPPLLLTSHSYNHVHHCCCFGVTAIAKYATAAALGTQLLLRTPISRLQPPLPLSSRRSVGCNREAAELLRERDGKLPLVMQAGGVARGGGWRWPCSGYQVCVCLEAPCHFRPSVVRRSLARPRARPRRTAQRAWSPGVYIRRIQFGRTQIAILITGTSPGSVLLFQGLSSDCDSTGSYMTIVDYPWLFASMTMYNTTYDVDVIIIWRTTVDVVRTHAAAVFRRVGSQSTNRWVGHACVQMKAQTNTL